MAITAEQAKNRLGRIGSSDVPKILGVSPYGGKSPAKQKRDAYFSIMGLSPKTESSSMRDGVFLEPGILSWAEYKIGRPFERDAQLIHPKYDWMIASFDGLSDPNQANPFIVEAKWVENPQFQAHWGRAGTKKPDNIPIYVLAQMAHQMLVAGERYEISYAAALRAMNGFGLFAAPRDDELLGLIFEAEEKFYIDHILPRRAPELPAEEQEGSAA